MSKNHNHSSPELKLRVKELFSSQMLCVLSTDFQGQPYSNLLAFAETDDLRSIIFVTNRKTSKYDNALLNKKVAVLVDSRTNTELDFKRALAITAIGNAEELTGDQAQEYARLLVAKHPYLNSFVYNINSAIIRVNIESLVVASFNKTDKMVLEI